MGHTILKPSRDVVLEWNNGAGLIFTKTFSIDDKHLITVKQSVTNSSSKPVELLPYGLAVQRGLPKQLRATWILHEGPIGFVGEELHEMSYNSLRKDPPQSFRVRTDGPALPISTGLRRLCPIKAQLIRFVITARRQKKGKKILASTKLILQGKPLRLRQANKKA